MHTSRAQIDQALDPTNGNVTIETLQRAAAVAGRKVQVELVSGSNPCSLFLDALAADNRPVYDSGEGSSGVWDWLKKKTHRPENELKALAQQLLRPQSLAVALAEAVRDYAAAVQAGRVSYPAHRRERASVLEIWGDLRIEALHKLFNFGQSDPFLLSDQSRQEELLACFLDDRPHLEMPQPHGAVFPDTIQAMFQVYLYLSAAGSEVADRETDREGLRLKRRSILDRLESDCAEARQKWALFRAGATADTIPPTIVELLYTDVTAKAKSIALSKVFGPYYESGIKRMEGLLAQEGSNTAAFRASVERVLAAADPDHLAAH